MEEEKPEWIDEDGNIIKDRSMIDKILAGYIIKEEDFIDVQAKPYVDETGKIKKEPVLGVEEFESYTDYPEAAKRNAQIALDWAEKNGWGSCGTPVGKQRANQLAKGEPISEETIARMAAFERHRQNSQKELGDGCGRLMWQAWGGDEGIEWAQRKLEQIRKD